MCLPWNHKFTEVNRSVLGKTTTLFSEKPIFAGVVTLITYECSSCHKFKQIRLDGAIGYTAKEVKELMEDLKSQIKDLTQ